MSFPAITDPFGEGSLHITSDSGRVLLLPKTFYVSPDIPRGVDVTMRDWTFSHGSQVVKAPRLVSKDFDIVGVYFSNTYKTAQEQVDDLLEVLFDGPIKFRQDGAASRYLNCYLSSFSGENYGGDKIRSVSVGLVAPDPFEYNSVPQSITFSPPTNGSQTRIFNITGSYTALPTITVTMEGSTTSVTIVNLTNSDSLTYEGDASIGEKLVLNCSEFTAKLNGANVLDSMSTPFKTRGFSLEPGDNKVKIDVTGNISVKMEYRSRWI